MVNVKKEMEDSFAKMKKEKIDELNKRLEDKEKEIQKFTNEISTVEKRIEKSKADAKLLEDRIESLHPDLSFNGYYFNVSERLNEKIDLEPEIADLIKNKISKVKSIDPDKFMKLFENGEYLIRLGIKNNDTIEDFNDFDSLPDDIKKSIRKIGLGLEILDESKVKKMIAESHVDGTQVGKIEYKMSYVGDLTWGEIVNKMIKAGFGQDADFDKYCGSNSYKIYDSQSTEESVVMDSTTIEDLEDISIELEEFENSNGYPMGDQFVFAIHENILATNEIGDPQITFSISPKSYFDKEGGSYDNHLEWVLKSKFPILKELGDSFEELSEGTFDFCDEENEQHFSISETVDLLCKSGIIPSMAYQNHNSQKDIQTLIDTLEMLGHKNLLIA